MTKHNPIANLNVTSNMLVYTSTNLPDYFGQECIFQSIIEAFWWCIVTITAVGYGDVAPRSIAGKICAGVATVTNVLLLGFPITIFSANFTEIYRKDQVQWEVMRRYRHH